MCPQDHAYWAHYNHGPHYIDHGPARHYPHHIGVLYYALARTMGVDTTEVTTTRLTVNDPGRRPRTFDHPVEVRYQKLCQAIRDSKSACTGVTRPCSTSLWPEADICRVRSSGVSVTFCATTTGSPPKGGNFQRIAAV